MAQQLGPEQNILRLDNVNFTNDLKHVSFEIVTKDGKPHMFWCPTTDTGKLAHYLLNLSQFAAQQSGGLKRPDLDTKVTTTPIAAVAFGLNDGRSPDEAVLSVHIGTDSPVAFFASPNELAALRDLLTKHLVPIGDRKAN